MKEQQSPANEKLELPKNYKPMSTATLRLEVPNKPGWHRHWFRGTPGRLARAQQAGYRFVDQGDCDVNNFDLAGDSKAAGSTDLGSRVSVSAGDEGSVEGQAGRMYLMECPENLFEHSQEILGERLDKIADALKGGMVGAGEKGETPRDVANRYMKNTKSPSLFTKRT